MTVEDSSIIGVAETSMDASINLGKQLYSVKVK